MIFLCLTLLLSTSWAQTDGLCEILPIKNCRSISRQSRRASAQSLPSSVVASNLNPANIGQDKGIGIETIYQPKNPLAASLVSGTGKMGGALISSTLENSFFGNRLPELATSEIERREADKRYKINKINAGLSFALFKNKKYGADLGLLFKYNPDTKRVNPGAGLSVRAWILNFGASVYNDDFVIKFKDIADPSGTPYQMIYGDTRYQERFLVQSFTGGIRIQKLFLDVGVIQTKYKFENNEPSKILIYSAAYAWDRFLFNIASRKETSGVLKYDYSKNALISEKNKSDIYAGIQYSLNRFIILGVQYNYFLMRDTSFSATLFF